MAIELPTQYLVLAGLITNDYVYSKVSKDVDESYFSDPSSAIVFKSFMEYFKKYKKVPSEMELSTVIHDNYIPVGPSEQEVIQVSKNMIEKGPLIDQEYLMDEVEKFIKDVRVEKELTKFIEQYGSRGTVDMNGTAKKLSEASEYTLNNSGVMKLSSASDMVRAKEEAVGTDGKSRIISSVLPLVNESLAYHGYMNGTLSVIVSPPGCFTGDTKIMNSDGVVMTIEEMKLSESRNRVVSYDFNSDSSIDSSYDSVYLSKYVKELIEVKFNTGDTVRCTLDHPFLSYDNKYIKAEDLDDRTFLKGIAYFDNDDYKVIRKVPVLINRIKLDQEVPVYGLVDVGDNHNYVVMTGKYEGVIVSNTGKSSIMINEGAYASKQGFRVLNIFLGDMIEFDGFVRYAACITGEPQSTFSSMSEKEIHDFVASYSDDPNDNVLDRIDLLAYASMEVTASQLINTIMNQQKDMGYKYDLIIIDYADNFLTFGDNMYKQGGEVYDLMLQLARKNNCAVLSASQPKISSWKDELLPLESLGESSRKQHIVDLIISFNKPNRRSSVGTVFIPKVRRGITGNLARVKTDWSKCRIYQINEDEYNNIKAQELGLE